MLPFRIPPYVRANKRDISSCYEISAVGLAIDGISGVILDDRIALEQIHPTYNLALLPLSSGDRLSLQEVFFYAEFLSYIQEVPVIVIPHVRDFRANGISFWLDKRSPKETWKAYLGDLCIGLESVNALRWGPCACVLSVFPKAASLQHLDPRREYRHVCQELHLYANALRQLDIGAEYLNYYRVIESVSSDNEVLWLQQNLSRLDGYKFPRILGNTALMEYKPTIDLLAFMKRNATKIVRKFESYNALARHLCKIRNGIAHGKRSIQRSDLTIDLTTIYGSMFVVKLMARIGIEDKRLTLINQV